jgi:uncharacterized protein YndB with AHSA1/START domain
MLIQILLVVAALIALVLIYASTRPSVDIHRTTRINAPAEKIAPLISDFHQWPTWSPYDGRDSQMKRTYSGAESGRGAAYDWDGNDKVGKGRMEITDVAPPSRVTIKLDFDRPMKAHYVAEFTLQPDASATTVTWAMRGAASYGMKVMGIFMNMDNLVGKDFEVGLANLKRVTEQ